VFLRDLAGLALRNIENDMETECEVPLTQEIYHSFTEFRKKSRRAVLSALEDELHVCVLCACARARARVCVCVCV